jgi:hypothetical protein
MIFCCCYGAKTLSITTLCIITSSITTLRTMRPLPWLHNIQHKNIMLIAFRITKLSTTTLCLATLTTKTLSIIGLRNDTLHYILALSITTINTTTLSITALSIATQIITVLSITSLRISKLYNDTKRLNTQHKQKWSTQHNNTQHGASERRVSLFWRSWRRFHRRPKIGKNYLSLFVLVWRKQLIFHIPFCIIRRYRCFTNIIL